MRIQFWLEGLTGRNHSEDNYKYIVNYMLLFENWKSCWVYKGVLPCTSMLTFPDPVIWQ
jgi:hypothetical protein